MLHLLLAVILLAGVGVDRVWASALSDQLATMSVGQWAWLSPAPSNKTAVQCCTAWPSYSDGTVWNPVAKRLMFIGGGTHLANPVFALWDDATNAWIRSSTLPSPYTNDTAGFCHGYDGQTVNPVTGDFYFHLEQGCINLQGGYRLNKFMQATQSWVALPANSELGVSSCCSALAWVPELNGIVLFDSSNGKLHLYSETTGQWSVLMTITDVGSPTCAQLFAEYNSTYQATVIGCGNDTKIDIAKITVVDGKATETFLGSFAYNYYAGGPDLGHFTLDPVTGDYIFLTRQTVTAYRYNLKANTFTALPNQPTALLGAGSQYVSAAVSTYGAILYMVCSVDTGPGCLADILVLKLGPSNTGSATIGGKIAVGGKAAVQY